MGDFFTFPPVILHRDFASAPKKALHPRREAAVDKGGCEGSDEEESEDDWEEVEGKNIRAV